MVERFKSQEGQQLLYKSYARLLELWGVAIEEIVIDTTYGKTHIIIAGNQAKPPLLLFHGTGDNSAISWLNNIQGLAKHFYVMAVDSFAGVGKSEPNEIYTKKFNPALWIDDMLNVLHINKTNLAGVSYGVKLVLAYAIEKPQRVSKIVCMAAYIPLKNMEFYLLFLRAIIVFFPEILMPTAKNSIKLLQKMCGPNFDVDSINKELLNHWYYMLKYGRPPKQKIIFYDRKVFSAFRDKAIFLIGEGDRLVCYPAVIRSFEEHNLNYKLIKNAGHAIQWEQAELINAEIINFLSK